MNNKHLKTFESYSKVTENTIQTKPIFRSIIQVELLSDSPIPDGLDLNDINYEITEGGWSGSLETKIDNEKLYGKEAVDAIERQGSDTEFFGMDKNGNELDY